jgi:RNA polymerase sigma factor (sigma-70 family)
MNQIARITQETLDPARLAAERGRLVRYCFRIVRDLDAAEDLAQETLITAWRSQDRLRDGLLWNAWLTGIARNICLRWLRTQNRHATRMREPLARDNTASPFPNDIPDESAPDPADVLEKNEFAYLLDQAMASLPEKSRNLLVERYVDDLPLAEIAARRGIVEETIAVQLHRSRQALRKTLTTRPDLRETVIQYGLINDGVSGMQPTNIWCPRCGKARFMGRFGPYCPSAIQKRPQMKDAIEYYLYCPACDVDKSFFVHIVQRPDTTQLLSGVKGFKPALNRVHSWFYDFARDAARTGVVSCYKCGDKVPIERAYPDDYFVPAWRGVPAVYAMCSKCHGTTCISVPRMSLTVPETSEFWRRYQRLRMLPLRYENSASGRLLVTRIEAVESKAALDIVHSANTLEVVEIQRTA